MTTSEMSRESLDFFTKLLAERLWISTSRAIAKGRQGFGRIAMNVKYVETHHRHLGFVTATLLEPDGSAQV